MHSKPAQKFVSLQTFDSELLSGYLHRRFLDNERNIN